MSSMKTGKAGVRGRPRVPVRRQKLSRSIAFSKEEWGLVKHNAERMGLNVSQFVRGAALGDCKVPARGYSRKKYARG